MPFVENKIRDIFFPFLTKNLHQTHYSFCIENEAFFLVESNNEIGVNKSLKLLHWINVNFQIDYWFAAIKVKGNVKFRLIFSNMAKKVYSLPQTIQSSFEFSGQIIRRGDICFWN